MCFTTVLYRAINNNYRVCAIRYKKHLFRTLIADTFAKQMLGLMHRPSLKRSEAMLFVFGRQGVYPIWMLNMRFPIDILWLDQSLTVVSIVHSAKPCSSIFNCRSYSNSKKAAYVLETNAGVAKSAGIKAGSRLHAGAGCF